VTKKRRQYWFLLASAFVLIFLSIAGFVQANRPRVNIQSVFTPSGWMGDGEFGRRYIEFSGSDHTNPHGRENSVKITYRFGPTKWGGMYWQNKPDNWGDQPGNNYSAQGFSKVTFWARGEHGGEMLEFKVGGIDKQGKRYRDSVLAMTGRIALTKDWKSYSIDLSSQDLSSLIGGFCWVASADYNHGNQITFFLENLTME
jgi:hypothetical protein